MATLNFNTTNATFRQLMRNGLRYRVPPFQRDYSWIEDEWDDLWQDILGLFEDERQRSGQDFDFESATYTLEHILPESPSDAWNHIEETKQDRLIYRIGNMTPLETSRNRDLGNGDYVSKRSVYRQSCFHITKAIAEHYEVWDEAKIEARQKQLATVATGIWKIEFGG